MNFNPLAIKNALVEAAVALTNENDNREAIHLLEHAYNIQLYYLDERKGDPNTHRSAPIDTAVIETLMARSLFAQRDYINALHFCTKSHRYYLLEFGSKNRLTSEAKSLLNEIVYEMSSTNGVKHASAA